MLNFRFTLLLLCFERIFPTIGTTLFFVSVAENDGSRESISFTTALAELQEVVINEIETAKGVRNGIHILWL